MALFACKVGGSEGIDLKTDTATTSSAQNSWSITIPSGRTLCGIKSFTQSFTGGFWNNPSVSCNFETGKISFGGGGSTVDTRGTFTVTYTYTD